MSRREYVAAVAAAFLFGLVLVLLATMPAGATEAATADPVATLSPEVVGPSAAEPGLLGGPLALAVGSAAIFAALLIGAHRLVGAGPAPAALPTGPQAPALRRLHEQASGGAARRRPAIGSLATAASAVADRTLSKRGWNVWVDRELETAGLELRPGEFVTAVAASSVTAALVGFLFGGVAGAFLLLVVTVLGARVFLARRRSRRRRLFAEQLGDLLQQLAASLRAGHGLMQAVEGAAREAESPTKDELRRLTAEIRLGRDFVDSVAAVADRMENEDFRWVTAAIRIHREVGGDLAQVLDRVGDTIRARQRLHRQVRALSAEGRMSAWVLLAMPIVMSMLLSVLHPGYITAMFGSALGLAMLLAAGGLMAFGALWLRMLIRLDI